MHQIPLVSSVIHLYAWCMYKTENTRASVWLADRHLLELEGPQYSAYLHQGRQSLKICYQLWNDWTAYYTYAKTKMAVGRPFWVRSTPTLKTIISIRVVCDLTRFHENRLETSTWTPSTPAVPNCCCLKGWAPYWSNPPFLIFDIRALWHSVLSARMSKIKYGGLDQYGKV